MFGRGKLLRKILVLAGQNADLTDRVRTADKSAAEFQAIARNAEKSLVERSEHLRVARDALESANAQIAALKADHEAMRQAVGLAHADKVEAVAEAVRKADQASDDRVAEVSRQLRVRYAAMARNIASGCFWPNATWACEDVARAIEAD
jgi:uncharacterized membrane protein YqiK